MKEAFQFLIKLHKRFNDRRKTLLNFRYKLQSRIDDGKKPGFLAGKKV
ncbi:hypothetical protein ACFQ3N_10390 [Virgibacillus byunsanensis]|uniref:Malate synthase N-terminal domain-containing protein n=1 Tax=Virgibacillus byunsanensis TaxID=570945 RepID=A0ABW3LK78_9BACI